MIPIVKKQDKYELTVNHAKLLRKVVPLCKYCHAKKKTRFFFSELFCKSMTSFEERLSICNFVEQFFFFLQVNPLKKGFYSTIKIWQHKERTFGLAFLIESNYYFLNSNCVLKKTILLSWSKAKLIKKKKKALLSCNFENIKSQSQNSGLSCENKNTFLINYKYFTLPSYTFTYSSWLMYTVAEMNSFPVPVPFSEYVFLSRHLFIIHLLFCRWMFSTLTRFQPDICEKCHQTAPLYWLRSDSSTCLSALVVTQNCC